MSNNKDHLVGQLTNNEEDHARISMKHIIPYFKMAKENLHDVNGTDGEINVYRR